MTGSSIPRLQTASLPSSACEPRRSSAIVPSFRAFSLDPLLTLSLFWYLLETVVECHYTQTSLLPHLDCVLDSTDNVCRARPPLPSLQYNLLHQKLSLLNCCIEEKRNNAHSDDLSESDDDDPIYFDQYQTPITDDSLSPNPQTPSIEPGSFNGNKWSSSNGYSHISLPACSHISLTPHPSALLDCSRFSSRLFVGSPRRARGSIGEGPSGQGNLQLERLVPSGFARALLDPHHERQGYSHGSSARRPSLLGRQAPQTAGKDLSVGGEGQHHSR